jgi:transcriptional antiterminator RfaH
MTMQRWYVVHTRAGAELLAQGHLERQGFASYLPRYLKTRRHARRTTQLPAPLFPRYLFVRFDIGDAPWRSINGTHGVSHLVCMGNCPSAVPRGVVSELRTRETEDGLVGVHEPLGLESGDVVCVTGGPLAQQTGVFQNIDADRRVVILLSMLGREMKVTLGREAVAAFA